MLEACRAEFKTAARIELRPRLPQVAQFIESSRRDLAGGSVRLVHHRELGGERVVDDDREDREPNAKDVPSRAAARRQCSIRVVDFRWGYRWTQRRRTQCGGW